MWARYSSAQFDQGSGRHACNNPYDRSTDDEVFATMHKGNFWKIPYDKFLQLIQPSFSAVEDPEDMDAIMARTHLIVITDHGLYFRVANTSKDPVGFIRWEENAPKDLLSSTQTSVFKQYKMNPDKHQLPPSYHEDCLWSQEVLRRLLHGESVPSSYIHHSHSTGPLWRCCVRIQAWTCVRQNSTHVHDRCTDNRSGLTSLRL